MKNSILLIAAVSTCSLQGTQAFIVNTLPSVVSTRDATSSTHPRNTHTLKLPSQASGASIHTSRVRTLCLVPDRKNSEQGAPSQDVSNQKRNGRRKRSSSALYYAPNQDTSKPSHMASQAFYKHSQKPRTTTSSSSKLHATPLSNSVLSSSDTLPSFPTAHGLLSPETVMRMEDRMKHNNDASCHAVNMFLDKYKSEGPMSCLSFLTDDEVLPRLTEAMRDIL